MSAISGAIGAHCVSVMSASGADIRARAALFGGPTGRETKQCIVVVIFADGHLPFRRGTRSLARVRAVVQPPACNEYINTDAAGRRAAC